MITMENWATKAVAKMEAERKSVTERKAAAMAPEVMKALKDFCVQNEEFAQAIAEGGSFKDCMSFVAKGVGTSISDLEAYKKAVELDEANYLLFALAFRWVSRLSYVRNPKSHQDIPKQLLNLDGDIHLRSFISQMMEGKNGKEPVIPFDVYDDYTQFNTKGYDFVTMAQSPRYAPASADKIMKIVERYIRT